MSSECRFDELIFFAQVKRRPGCFLGKDSLLSLRDQLFGMQYAFSFCQIENPLKYFSSFVEWYQNEVINDLDGYACWWNHILYISGNNDADAFHMFFEYFERYLKENCGLCLPDVK